MRRSLALAIALFGTWTPLSAVATAAPIVIPFPGCAAGAVGNLEVEIPARPPAAGETVKLTIRGEADYCARVTAVAGDLSLLAPSSSGLGVVVGVRSVELPPGVNCPAAIVPFELELRLPESLPAAGPPNVIPVEIMVSLSPGALGEPVGLYSCGALDFPAPSAIDSTELVLQDRFSAGVTWTTPAGATGVGAVVPDSVTGTGGLIWFFDRANPELLLKILDGCPVNGHYWVFGAGATNVGYTVAVQDLETAASWQRTQPPGPMSRAFADTRAFPCGAP